VNDLDHSVSSISPLTIFAVHGNGGGAFRFERIKSHIPAEIHFQPVTLPGFAGQPADPTLRSLYDYAAYLRGITAASPRPLVLLGHGTGGSLALEFIQHFAAELDGLILHAPVGTRLEARLFPRLMALPGARWGRGSFQPVLLARCSNGCSSPSPFLPAVWTAFSTSTAVALSLAKCST
jgi:alpha-beta hydrolase superfamily lysophospholipase